MDRLHAHIPILFFKFSQGIKIAQNWNPYYLKRTLVKHTRKDLGEMVEMKFLGMDFSCALNSLSNGEFPEKDCLLPLISKILGYGIVAASTTVKLPQVITLLFLIYLLKISSCFNWVFDGFVEFCFSLVLLQIQLSSGSMCFWGNSWRTIWSSITCA